MRAGGHDLGIAFDGDGDRMLAVDEHGEIVDGDQIVAVLALALGVDQVAVTVMANLGFHRLMEERGITVHLTDVGDRYVLEALRREGALLGGEQSGHVIWLGDHVTGDGLAAALLLCGALAGRTLSEAVAVMPRLPAGQGERPGHAPRGAAERESTEAARVNERARRKRSRARPAVRHGAPDPGARRGRNRGRGREALWYDRRPRQRGARLARGDVPAQMM